MAKDFNLTGALRDSIKGKRSESIMKAYREGVFVPQIAKDHKVSKRTVQRIVSNYKSSEEIKPMKSTRRAVLSATIEEALCQILDGRYRRMETYLERGEKMFNVKIMRCASNLVRMDFVEITKD